MSKKTITVLLLLVLAVNFSGLFGTIFNIDSTLYAVISKSFSVTNDYLNIYVNGVDWLDKPHFPFWVAALSIKLFGITSFAYKLPSFLFFVLGLYYTYQLAACIYNKQTAFVAVLIVGSALQLIISNNDVRAEAILAGTIMGATYYMYLLTHQYSLKNILLVSLFSAAAIMTKGIFVMIIIYSAIFLDLLVRQEYQKIFQPRWIVVGLLSIVFITPELYAVYQQFDLHPEKIVFDQKNVSGLKFFIWDSQFGRFFNTGPIKGSGELLFFVHTILWAFAPWALLGFVALFEITKKLFKKDQTQEYLTYFGFVIMFVIFSVSKFQLSHYVNIIFPFLAILIARFFVNQTQNKLLTKTIKYSILAYTALFMIVIALIEIIFKTAIPLIGWTFIFVIFCSTYYILTKYKNSLTNSYLVVGVCSGLLFALYLNLSFYPSLLKYQSGSEMAFYLQKNHPNKTIKVTYNDWALQYYSQNKLVHINTINELKANDLLFTDIENLNNLRKKNYKLKILTQIEQFHITILNGTFFNHKTRNQATSLRYLIEIQK